MGLNRISEIWDTEIFSPLKNRGDVCKEEQNAVQAVAAAPAVISGLLLGAAELEPQPRERNGNGTSCGCFLLILGIGRRCLDTP